MRRLRRSSSGGGGGRGGGDGTRHTCLENGGALFSSFLGSTARKEGRKGIDRQALSGVSYC